MISRHRSLWQSIGLSSLIILAGAPTLSAQNPAYRPNVQWHIAAPSGSRAYAFTEDGKYLLAEGGVVGRTIQIYDVEKLANPNTPRGTALVSFDDSGSAVFFFTDRDEAQQEYVIASSGRFVTMWRWVRNQNAYGGGYLEQPKSWSINQWSSAAVLVLRGDRTDRRYNRLAVSGDANGALRITLLNPTATSQQAVGVQGAHGAAISALAYDPATRRLISGGADGLIRVWQVALDANNTPSLTPLQTVAAHWGEVMSLALAQVGANRYLVSVSESEGTLHGWQWNASGNPINPSPLWSQPIDSFLTESHSTSPVLSSAPYGDYDWVVLSVIATWYTVEDSHVFLIDPLSGQSVYRMTATLSLSSPRATPIVISPTLSSGGRYWAGNITSNSNTFAGVWQPSFRRPQTLATSQAPATAIDAIVHTGTRYLAVGYADGAIRLYRNTGSGWQQSTSSTTLHPNKRIVGVRLIVQGNRVFTLSADVDGQIAIAEHTNTVTPRASASSGLTAAGALALGADTTSALVAIGGQKDGAPRVETLRLTWSGTTPTFASLAGFTLTNQIGHVASLQFAAASSADLIASTGNQVSRWNFSNGNYTSAGNFTYPNVTFAYAPIATAGGTLYIGPDALTPTAYDVASRNRLCPFYQARTDIAFPSTVTTIVALNSNQAVWGLAHQLPSRDGAYALARGAVIDASDAAYTTWNQEWHALLPDEPTAIARDPNNPDVFYVACINGAVQEVLLPDYRPIHYAGYITIGGEFGVRGDELFNVLGTYPKAFYTYGTADYNQGVAIDVRTGNIRRRIKLCNPDGTGCGATTSTFAFSNFTLVDTDGRVYFSELPLLYAQQKVNVFDLSLSNRLAFRLLNSNYWYPQLLEATKIAYFSRMSPGTCDYNNTTYRKWQRDLRVLDAQSSTLPEIGPPLQIDITRYIISGHFYGGQEYKWDLNASRTLFAVLGPRADSSICASSAATTIVLYKRNSPNWLDWQESDSLGPSDFPRNVTPTSIRFHPLAPDYLYVGLSNGRLRLYRLNLTTGQIVNRSQPVEFTPQLPPGGLGAVAVMDVATYVNNGINQTALVFGGPNGLSIWGGSICRPNSFYEVAFYDTDIAFFTASGSASVRIVQPDPNSAPYLVYGCGHVLSAALLDNLPAPGCAADVNQDGIVDDADLLEVLFSFGGPGFIPADVNCDGIVDDADLLIVLFNFGNQC